MALRDHSDAVGLTVVACATLVFLVGLAAGFAFAPDASPSGTSPGGFWNDTFPQWAMAFFAAVAAGTSIWGILLLRGTLEQTRLATEAATESASVSREAYITDQRPWLIIEATAYGEPKVSDNLFVTDVQFTITNFGKTPATDVRWSAQAHEVNKSNPARIVEDVMASLAEDAVVGDPFTQLIAPGKDEKFRPRATLSLAKTSITPVDRAIRHMAYVSCGVSYRSILGDREFHSVGLYIFMMDQSEEDREFNQPPLCRVFKPLGGDRMT